MPSTFPHRTVLKGKNVKWKWFELFSWQTLLKWIFFNIKIHLWHSCGYLCPSLLLHSSLRPNNKNLKSYRTSEGMSLLHLPPPAEVLHAQGKALGNGVYFAEMDWLESWQRLCFSHITGPAHPVTITEYLVTSQWLFIRNNCCHIFLLIFKSF